MPCTEIRAEWAAQRIQGLSLARAILNATAIQRRSNTIKSLINEFRYPRLGPGQMWEACRDRLREMGSQVLMRHRATEITCANGGATGVRALTPDGPEYFPADHVISTTDLRTLVGALEPAPPDVLTLERGDGAGAGGRLARDGVLLLGGRRPVGQSRRGPHRAGDRRAGAARDRAARPGARGRRDPDAQGLSDLRRGVPDPP